MSKVQYCQTCRWRTEHKRGVCQVCEAETGPPDTELEEAGQVPLFPLDQIAS